MPKLPRNLTWNMANTLWAAIIDPFLGNAINQGVALTDVALVANTPQTLSHFLGRTPQGFFPTDQNAAASIYRTQPFNNKTLTLESSATVTVNLWVY